MGESNVFSSKQHSKRIGLCQSVYAEKDYPGLYEVNSEDFTSARVTKRKPKKNLKMALGPSICESDRVL